MIAFILKFELVNAISCSRFTEFAGREVLVNSILLVNVSAHLVMSKFFFGVE